MIPVLFSIGPFKVYSYGLMLAVAFLLGSAILASELRRKKIDPRDGREEHIASNITVIAVIAGIIGAKLLSVIEDWNIFLQRPWQTLFSPGGLTWYGGFVLGMVAVYLYIRKKRIPYLKFLDALGIALILAYGVGRIGCHLAGDGDYGYPTTLPWGTIYAKGIVKPSYALEGYFERHPVEREEWHYDSLRVIPAGVDNLGMTYSRFDEVTPLHPAPIYELILGIIGFGILWSLRRKPLHDGTLFMLYLTLTGLFRFSVEFLRLNPQLLFGLTEAQLVSIVLFIGGITGAFLLQGKAVRPRR